MPVGTKCAVLTTEPSPHPDTKAEKLLSDEEIGKCQHVSPIMLGSLRDKDLAAIASMKVYVTGLKGPLETGWQGKVRSFTDTITNASDR